MRTFSEKLRFHLRVHIAMRCQMYYQPTFSEELCAPVAPHRFVLQCVESGVIQLQIWRTRHASITLQTFAIYNQTISNYVHSIVGSGTARVNRRCEVDAVCFVLDVLRFKLVAGSLVPS